MKSKADEFIKNKDYYSAITAYTDMEDAEPDNLVAISNKIICNIKLFNYEEVINDTECLINKINAYPE